MKELLDHGKSYVKPRIRFAKIVAKLTILLNSVEKGNMIMETLYQGGSNLELLIWRI